jgi:phospholipid/cholesterol/gamma-HCH transport system permease protein
VTSFSLFFRQVFAGLGFGDVLPAVIKTFLFGFAIGMVGCYRGYNSRNGTQGVGRSANSAVVISSILVFVIDLMVVQVTALMGLN